MKTQKIFVKIIVGIMTIASFITACSGSGSGGHTDRNTVGPDTLTTGGKTENPVVVQPKASFDTLQNGDFVARYPNGVIQMRGYYKNGKREGEWACFFPSGKVQSEGYFTQGKRDHKGVVYYENGQKMYEGMYKSGIQVGLWTFYDTAGKVKQKIDYDKQK